MSETVRQNTIRFWCPAAHLQVALDCEVQDTELISIQVAVPKTCWRLRHVGCPFRDSKNCLLGKQIQGNYSLRRR